MSAETAFIDVVSRVAEILRMAPAVAGTVERNRLRTLPEECRTAAVVRLSRSQPSLAEILGGSIDWRTAFAVECYARADSEQEMDAAVDPILRAVYARLAADETLGGAVMALEAGAIEWEFSTTSESVAVAVLNFSAMHQTAHHTLESIQP